MTTAFEPTTIHFEDRDLDDLRERLARSRLPEPIAGAGWDYGVDVAWLAALLEHWRTRFDWRAVERELDSFENGFVDAGGRRVHVLRARSPHPGAMPLMLTHGWPGSVLEFRKVLGPLADPVAHGGDARDAFDVVCPSIPGYGLSPMPRERGFDVKALGRTLADVMHALGYERYGAQGGDWGAMATSYLALADPGRCIGIHLNMVLAGIPEDGPGELTAEELASLESARAYMKTGTAYQKVQGLEPDLVGIGLTDSPAALCAWIVSKFRMWSDCGGDVERRFTKDELLANVTWYWLTRSGASAARLYYESQKSRRFRHVEGYVSVPTGCALFPREIFVPPRAWAEKLYNVQRWTKMPAGGHFAAMEEPQALVDDIRAFFRELR